MKIGIDSYCFHRYFGEVYPDLQRDPGVTWRMEREFLDFAFAQDIDEVALESCFFDALDDGLCAEIKGRLDDAQLDLGDCRNAGDALQRLVESLSRESASGAAEIERLGAELAEQSRALAESEAALSAATARCAGLETQLATRSGVTHASRVSHADVGLPGSLDASIGDGGRRAAT